MTNGYVYYTVPCPVCQSPDVQIIDHESKPWKLYELFLHCRHCDAEFRAHYEHYKVTDIVMGAPAGPAFVCRMDDPRSALAVWDQDECQWIRTDCKFIAVGYEPALSRFFPPSQGWIDTNPEEMAQHAREIHR